MKIRSMLLIAGISELRLQLLTPKSHLSPDYGNDWQSPRKIRSMLPDSFSDPIGQLLDVSYKCQPVIKKRQLFITNHRGSVFKYTSHFLGKSFWLRASHVGEREGLGFMV